MRKLFFGLMSISVLLFFQFNIIYTNNFDVSTSNYIDDCMNGQAIISFKIKEDAKKVFCRFGDAIKSLYSYNPPRMVLGNSMISLIVSFIIFKCLGIDVFKMAEWI